MSRLVVALRRALSTNRPFVIKKKPLLVTVLYANMTLGPIGSFL
jgi:hypothetical protein